MDIVLTDSGNGGKAVLTKCVKLMPEREFAYFADTENAPYGNKSRKKLIRIADTLVRRLIKDYNPRIIVFACNTLTAAAISYIRNKYPQICFIGTQPAIKPALTDKRTEMSPSGGEHAKTTAAEAKPDRKSKENILVFATHATLKYSRRYIKKCVKEFGNGQKVRGFCYRNLAKIIDENIDNPNSVEFVLKKITKNKKFVNADKIVLGCTHFILIKEQLEKALGHSVVFYDGAKGVAERTKFMADKLIAANKK